MGLDQYLERRHYVRRWDHIPDDKQFLVTVTRGGKPYAGIDPMRVSGVIEHIAYWRKANAIHAWFVKNVQGGVDECQEAHVSIEQLRELLNAVDTVLQNPDVAADLLPTQSGFFFGDTSYGEDYQDDLLLTKRQLEPLMEDGSDADYYYHASW